MVICDLWGVWGLNEMIHFMIVVKIIIQILLFCMYYYKELWWTQIGIYKKKNIYF